MASRSSPLSYAALDEGWTALVRAHVRAMQALACEARLDQTDAVHRAARTLFNQSPDGALYFLIHTSGLDLAHYSSRHSLLTMLTAHLMARLLDWEQPVVESVETAALTMNVAMTDVQNQLAKVNRRPTKDEADVIDRHAQAAERVLSAAGVKDSIVLSAVRDHHTEPKDPPGSNPDEQTAAALLRQADIFTAKLSCRGNRIAMSPLHAARQTCITEAGKPDSLGAALIKALGLYPPGSYVRLNSDEMAIVVARGARADQPTVSVVMDKDGVPVTKMLLRSTAVADFAVKQCVAANQFKNRPPHERIFE